jgi:hypothetical protein
MTNHHDLRIGNWIQDVGEGELFQVDKISKDRIIAGAMTIYPAGFEFDHYVPLTEEWLLKFGFKFELDSYYIDLHPSVWGFLSIDKQDFSFSLEKEVGDVAIPGDAIKYVHQLQNLYFALTGLELTIK